MAIWMDMTNSLRVWQGGVVGIVRAELEIAKNLKAMNPKLRISILNEENCFVEISDQELNWLWSADSVADSYLKNMNRENKKQEKKSEANKFYQKVSGLRNAYAYSDSRLQRLKRAGYIIKENTPKVLRPAEYIAGGLVYLPVKTGSVIRVRYKKRKEQRRLQQQEKEQRRKKKEFSYPYQERDLIVSVGWYTSEKERMFSKVKARLKNFYLVYLVYDIILIKKGTTQFYPESGEFQRYFEWISNNCDMVLYGGKTAQEDAEAYQKENGLRVPHGEFIKFGADVKEKRAEEDKTTLLKKFNLTKPYLLTVGSIEPRKNHEVLYKAYSILADLGELEQMPQIVIVGGEYRCENFRNALLIDPKIKGKIKILHPNDQELDLLYQNCLFVVLPTLYEGWSLTLPEALSYHKLCLVSDVKPLREVGGEFAEYIDALNPVAWAEAIKKYTISPNLIAEKEEQIKKNWKKITWMDCSKQILSKLEKIERQQKKGTLYYDLTLVWSLSFQGASVSGILRTVLILARYLGHIFPQMHFFSFSTVKGYIEIDRSMIAEILGSQTIEQAFLQSRYALTCAEGNKKSDPKRENQQIKEALWLLCSILPENMQKRTIIENNRRRTEAKKKGWLKVPFCKEDTIFSAGTGYDMPIYKEIVRLKEQIGFQFIQLIYDFTPILFPQVHRKETIAYYKPFLKYVMQLSDVIFYGGETAMRDGTDYQKKNRLPEKPGRAIQFGSNIVTPKEKKQREGKQKQEEKELEQLGVTGPFIIAVGSIEIRKNHETLYQAYLRLLEQEEEALPQLIFVGYPGWKTEELIQTICKDERIWDKILIRTPTDEQLDILYRNCLFTVLASQYEGWSLTLPESLNYGKFCIASKVEPLIEIGKDFIDYVHPWDVAGWAEKMLFYSTHLEELKKKEKRIAKEWHAITWEECANQVADYLTDIMEERDGSKR